MGSKEESWGAGPAGCWAWDGLVGSVGDTAYPSVGTAPKPLSICVPLLLPGDTMQRFHSAWCETVQLTLLPFFLPNSTSRRDGVSSLDGQID
jgi:hypothetical protein